MVLTFMEGMLYPGYQPDGVEGALVNYDKNGCIITILLPGVQDCEIEAVKKAPITFYLNKVIGAIYVSFDVGHVLLFDCPYSIHRVSAAERQIPHDPGSCIGLPIILVDSESGIVKAIRLITLSGRFSLLFGKLILQQMKEPYDQDSYETDLKTIENLYSPQEMRRMSLITYKTKMNGREDT